jgi:ABC-type transport system substrate-binding protein
MNNKSLWARPLARRRVIQGGSGLLLGGTALGLLGCGSDEHSSSSTRSGIKSTVSMPQDTTAQAKAGGTFQTFVASESNTFDVIAGGGAGATLSQVSPFAYQRLVQFALAKFPQTPTGDVVGDFAESWELSPDRLQLTMKLRRGNKWDRNAPTSGRDTDAQDVLWTYNKLRASGNYKNDVVYDAKLAPDAPVETMTAPDANTITFKLRKPSSSLLSILAGYRNSFFIMPRETEGGFNPKFEIRGSGPWRLEKYLPSVGVTWTKNPDYYQKGLPYFDKYEQHTIPEHITQLAQFKAGNIWTNAASSSEIIQTRKDAPATLLFQASSFSTLTGINFGYSGDSPFKDRRVRQAANMALDRETVLNSLEDIQKFKSEGIDVSTRYHTSIAAAYENGWLDPADAKKFGPSAKYYSFNLTEAKKLLAAAGLASGFNTTLFTSDIQTPTYVQWAQIIPGMLADVGIKAALNPRADVADYIPNYHYAYTGNYWGETTPGFNGMLLRKSDVLYPSADQAAYVFYHKNGASFIGMSPDGDRPDRGDPKINSMIETIAGEFDKKKQTEMVYELQRVQAEESYRAPFPGYSTKALAVVWPVIGNYGVHVPPAGVNVPGDIHLWMDSSKPPLAK